MYSSTKRIDDKLGDADEDSTHALVTNTQDLFSIANHNHVNVVGATKLVDVVFHSVDILNIQIASFGPTEQPRVVRNRITFRRGIYDWEHFFQMVKNKLYPSTCENANHLLCCFVSTYPIVQHVVLFLHTRHERILGQVVGPRAVLRVRALDLLLKRLHIGRQQAVQFECVALLLGKGRALVEIGCPEKRAALCSSQLCDQITCSIVLVLDQDERKLTVKLVFCGPKVDKGRWENFFGSPFLCCCSLAVEFDDMFAICMFRLICVKDFSGECFIVRDDGDAVLNSRCMWSLIPICACATLDPWMIQSRRQFYPS